MPARLPPVEKSAPCRCHKPCLPMLQDMRGCLTPAEVCTALGLPELRGRRWQVQGAVAINGTGLYEGLDWLGSAGRQ